MKSFFFIALVITVSLSKPIEAADNIASCGSLNGYTHYRIGAIITAESAGWTEDSITKGKTSLKKIGTKKYDILYTDTTGNIYSSRQDGASIFLVRNSGKDLAFVVFGKRGEIEIYNFYQEPNGAFKMDWAQNKGLPLLVQKSTLMTAECSFINFTNIK
jgi:hypothetical protein